MSKSLGLHQQQTTRSLWSENTVEQYNSKQQRQTERWTKR